jgi:C-terminal processing protease CtpA/Prc
LEKQPAEKHTMKTSTLIFCLFLTAAACQATPDNPPPKFDEIYKVLGANLAGVTPEQLNDDAVQGLLEALRPRVTLVSASASQAGASLAPLAQARVFDQSYAYFRVASVNEKLLDSFREAYRTMNQTNGGKIKGVVLDLRFADGVDYQAAAKTADCFINADEPLLDWQQGSLRASKKSDAILTPVAILINTQTAGAAEALAAALREAGVGLILGSTTAGQAVVFKEFPLSNGDKLRVAVAGVIVGDGKTLTNGVTPDVAVEVSLNDERAYLQDPYKDLHPAEVAQPNAGSASAAEARPRFNEAELVREHKEGAETYDESDIVSPALTGPAPGPPTMTDPTLARALDLLKSLAVIEPNRPG